MRLLMLLRLTAEVWRKQKEENMEYWFCNITVSGPIMNLPHIIFIFPSMSSSNVPKKQ